MKLIKKLLGVPDGEIYPIEYLVGDDCPDELLDAAKSLGAVETDDQKQAKNPK